MHNPAENRRAPAPSAHWVPRGSQIGSPRMEAASNCSTLRGSTPGLVDVDGVRQLRTIPQVTSDSCGPRPNLPSLLCASALGSSHPCKSRPLTKIHANASQNRTAIIGVCGWCRGCTGPCGFGVGNGKMVSGVRRDVAPGGMGVQGLEDESTEPVTTSQESLALSLSTSLLTSYLRSRSSRAHRHTSRLFRPRSHASCTQRYP
ncbi:hypothetical protein OF83DRAFT_256696 [Amylostereum chailletii]|nr:hypothetical protein OF83DRAFT_256696 [Amylostereum chailletii]